MKFLNALTVGIVLLCGTLLAETMVIYTSDGKSQRIAVSNIDSIAFDTEEGVYPWHERVKASTFWAGEGASNDNGNISNYGSSWNSKWAVDFGLEDHPLNISRNSDHIPTSSKFTGKENPYYVALPYNDFSNLVYDGKGATQYTDKMIGGQYGKKMSSQSACYWKESDPSISACKNKWVEIRYGGKTVYAQWEDAGPYYYEDTAYVFGSSKPLNTTDSPYAGIDLSPSCWLYLGMTLTQWGFNGDVDWRFIDEKDVPDGPWKKHVTTTQVKWD